MKSTNCSSAPARIKEKQQRQPSCKERAQRKSFPRFKERWSTLKRKAEQLADLCNGQVCMVMSESNDKLEVWPNPGYPATAEVIMMKYLEAHNDRSFMRKKLELNLSDFSEVQETEAVDTAKGFKSHHKSFAVRSEEFDKFSRDSCMDLSLFLKSKIQKLDETIRSTEVSHPVYMNQNNGHSGTSGGSFGQISEMYGNNIYNSSPALGFLDCHKNLHEGISGTTALNSGRSVILNADTTGFQVVENSMQQQRTQNTNGFGEADLLSHHDKHQQCMGPTQSHPSHFDEVLPISVWS